MADDRNSICRSEKHYSVIAEFDKLADSYENNRLSKWYKASNRMLLENFSKNESASVLDIGCATGWLLRQIIKENLVADGVGIDISPQMVSKATIAAERDKALNLKFINADWEKVEFDYLYNKKFHVAICTHTFHYFSNPIRSLERIRSCLHKGGVFYLVERDKTNSVLTHVWQKIHLRILRDQVRFYSAADLQNMMVKAGFVDTVIWKKMKRLFWKNKMYTSLVMLRGFHPQ